MSEKLNKPNNNIEVGAPPQRFPTEAELRAFEEERERWGPTFGQLAAPSPIEDFARDPANPAPDELKFMKDYNEMVAGKLLSFEDYFGYPDPREQPDTATGHGQIQKSESKDAN